MHSSTPRVAALSAAVMLALGVCVSGSVLTTIQSGTRSAAYASSSVLPAMRLRGGGEPELFSKITENVAASFKEVYGSRPTTICVAPASVNLIGEHTDYNEGFVLPCAIDFHACAAITPNEGKVFEVARKWPDFDGEIVKINLSEPMHKDKTASWSNHIRGVIKVLQEEKGMNISGGKMAIGGKIPQGGVLCSTAALEMATATALNHINGLNIGPKELAMAGQSAERWVSGTSSDQGGAPHFAAVLANKGKAVMIDRRDFSTTEVDLPQGVSVMIVNSNSKEAMQAHDDMHSSRRAQCEEAARHFGVTSLRDVTWEMLNELSSDLDPETRKRAWHVVTENQRTLQAVDALKRGDLRAMGELMHASHASMRDDFEISTPEIDALVHIIEGVLMGDGGVRLAGGGFGGAVVCLVPTHLMEAVAEAVDAEYPKRSGGIKATVCCFTASQGARVL